MEILDELEGGARGVYSGVSDISQQLSPAVSSPSTHSCYPSCCKREQGLVPDDW
jgi:hypothetical protein